MKENEANILKQVIIYLEFRSREKDTCEYEWRECCGLIHGLKTTFPEIDTEELKQMNYYRMDNNAPINDDNSHDDFHL